MQLIKTHFGVICILPLLWWSMVMDDWNLDNKSLNMTYFSYHLGVYNEDFINFDEFGYEYYTIFLLWYHLDLYNARPFIPR